MRTIAESNEDRLLWICSRHLLWAAFNGVVFGIATTPTLSEAFLGLFWISFPKAFDRTTFILCGVFAMLPGIFARHLLGLLWIWMRYLLKVDLSHLCMWHSVIQKLQLWWWWWCCSTYNIDTKHDDDDDDDDDSYSKEVIWVVTVLLCPFQSRTQTARNETIGRKYQTFPQPCWWLWW